ncbi:hypothetical protein DA2_1650 [Desulfovibrio sp. A2]|nr:hypothetical protein DA2_1650 [Desulfovibrio sp. A2]
MPPPSRPFAKRRRPGRDTGKGTKGKTRRQAGRATCIAQ